MEDGQKQELFNYFQQEHDILLMECDFNEIEKILGREPRQSYWHCDNYGETLLFSKLKDIDLHSQQNLEKGTIMTDKTKETANLHSNPDAQVWAKYFMETKEKNNWSIKDIDEELMIAWFANAMMAIGDHIYQTKTVTEKGDCKVKLNFIELKEEYEKLFMVTDKTEMIGTAINAKLNDVFEWIEQKVKHDYRQLPTNEEIETWAFETYKRHENSRWFEPLKMGAMWMRDIVVSNSNMPNKKIQKENEMRNKYQILKRLNKEMEFISDPVYYTDLTECAKHINKMPIEFEVMICVERTHKRVTELNGVANKENKKK